MLERISDGLVAVNRDWRYTFVNARAGELLGRSPDELIGKNMWAEFPEGPGDPFFDACHTAMVEQVALDVENLYVPWGRWFENRIYPASDGLTIFFQDVTARKDTERALAESSAFVRSMFDLANDAIFVADAESGQLVNANRRAQEMVGRTLDEIRRMHQRELHPPDKAERYEQIFRAHAREGRTVAEGLEVAHRDGHVIPVDVSVAVISVGGRDLIQGIFRDVSALHVSGRAARESAARLAAILETASDGILITDALGTLEMVNAAAETMFGYAAAEIVGQSVDILAPATPSGSHGRFIAEYLRTGVSHVIGSTRELEARRKDGSVFPIELTVSEVKLAERRVFTGFVRDISERRRASAALQESERRLSLVFETSRDVLFLIGVEAEGAFRFIAVNHAFLETTGLAREQVEGRLVADVIPEPSLALVMEEYRGAIETRATRTWEEVTSYPAGIRVGVVSVTPVIDGGGRCTHLVGSVHDVTGMRAAAEALRQSEERFRLLYEQSPVGVFEYDLNLRITGCNEQFANILRSRRDVLVGLDMTRLKDQSVLPALRAALRGERGGYEGPYSTTTSGVTISVSMLTAPLLDERGAVTGATGIVEDVTDWAKTQHELRESEERYRTLFDGNPSPMWVYDLETLRFLAVNDAAVGHYGYSRDEFLSMTLRDIRPEAELARLEEAVDRVRQTPGYRRSGVWRHRRKDGAVIDVELSSDTLTFAGRPAEAVLVHDVTERQRIERELRESEERYRSFFEDDLTADFISTPEGRIVDCNPAFLHLFGLGSKEEALATPAAELYPTPESRTALLDLIRERRTVENFEHELRRGDGTSIYVIENVIGLFSASGELEGLKGYIFDITPRKRLEDELRQAQKMEAVGRLAGGVAHDFNNILMAIMGSAELLLLDLDERDPNRPTVQEIRHSVDRAAALTRQLLAFSRRQVLQPREIDLNEVVRGLGGMLGRLIGEDIELEVRDAPGLGRVMADVGQIEQVIVNLAVNARDAMPDGGKLTIETANVEIDEALVQRHVEVSPGDYVMIAISDTGSGMDEEVRSHLFEPFFTTKTMGRGTGLGLSTVYGIVRQSGGAIWVYSEVGEGTVFKIYLPRVPGSGGGGPGATPGVPTAPITGGDETVLLVEDEPVVRDVARRILERFGYAVLEATSVDEAVLAASAHAGPIHLLLTDVVMPGMSGRELAGRLEARRPEMRVLYMSGYTDNAIVHHGVLDEGVAFLQKPFTPDQLARKVRAVLDA